MKYVVACIVMTVLVVASAAPEEGKFTTKYDNIKVDDILKTDRLLQNYIDCLLDKGPCPNDAKILKEAIPDALTNECKRCSDKQKENAQKVIKFLMQKKKTVFDELQAKFDPTGIYLKKYKKQLESP